jgi:hypothetical protein
MLIDAYSEKTADKRGPEYPTMLIDAYSEKLETRAVDNADARVQLAFYEYYKHHGYDTVT